MALAISAPGVSGQATTLPRLRTDGVVIRDAGNRKVVLRGTNLGGWLVEEMWMCPFVTDPPAGTSFPKIPDSHTLWNVLRGRFTAKEVQEVRTAYRDAWVTDADFDRIAALDLNHVRIPILHTIVDEPGGLDYLRKAVRRANARGLYVVLDMHGMPGSQSADHHTGREGSNRFFSDPANVEKGIRAWRALAKEFGANPGVAAFDLMNEPMGAPNAATLHVVHDRLIRAIREVAPDTMLIVEDGYKGFDTTPHADVLGWTNVIYSFHVYNFDSKKPEDHVDRLTRDLPGWKELRGYRNCPVYIGEWNLEPWNSPQVMKTYIETMDREDISWAQWTYKTVHGDGPMGFWGLYSNKGPIDAINPYTDTVAQMKAKVAQYRTEHLAAPEGLLEAVRSAGGSKI
jgi:aryl-phospho-beta-D-glucosidase BglC (GH1 family)